MEATDFKVGQTVYIVYFRYDKFYKEVNEVKSVGRVYITLKEGFRYRKYRNDYVNEYNDTMFLLPNKKAADDFIEHSRKELINAGRKIFHDDIRSLENYACELRIFENTCNYAIKYLEQSDLPDKEKRINEINQYNFERVSYLQGECCAQHNIILSTSLHEDEKGEIIVTALV